MGHIFCNDSARLFGSGETIGVLAIGDSWFHYPFNNLITPLYTALERPTSCIQDLAALTSWSTTVGAARRATRWACPNARVRRQIDASLPEVLPQ